MLPHVKHLLVPVLVASLVAAAQSQQLKWEGCNGTGSTLLVVCANSIVPLDYTNITSDPTTQLELLTLPATNGPPKGVILPNFGGLGFESRHTLTLAGKLMLEYVDQTLKSYMSDN